MAAHRNLESSEPREAPVRSGEGPGAPSITRLLQAWGNGDEQATETLLSLVYAELKRQAMSYLRRERADHTLQPTALVHEAFMRLMNQKHVEWSNRSHFFGIAAQMMRRILVDHARERQAARRPPRALRIELDDEVAVVLPADVEVLMLDEALDHLARLSARQAAIVELKYFGGLSEDDVAALLSISRATVTREWQAARAWLFRHMTTDCRE